MKMSDIPIPKDANNEWVHLSLLITENFAKYGVHFENIEKRLAVIETVQKSVTLIEERTSQMRRELDNHMSKIEALTQNEVDHKTQREELKEIEKRLASVERQVWYWAGGASLVGAALGYIVPLIIQALSR